MPVNISFAVLGSVISIALTLFVYSQSRYSGASGSPRRERVTAHEESNTTKRKTKSDRVAKQNARQPRGYREADGTEDERRVLLRENQHARGDGYGAS